jgi:membrane protease YdiL (CAAX protease family)
VTEEDLAARDPSGVAPAWMGVAPDPAAPEDDRGVPPGPPGGRVFSLVGRPAPALYLLAWMLSVGGVTVLFVTAQAAPSTARSASVLVAILAIGLGLACGAGYQVVARRATREPAWYRGPSPVLAFGVVLALSTLASALVGATGALDPDEPVGFLTGLAVVALAYVATVWILVVRTGSLSWAEMGWPTAGPRRLERALTAVGWAVLVMLPATFGALILGGILATILGVEAPDVLPTPSTSLEALAVALAAAIVAPVGEELFFRGFALTAWARDLPARTALVRSAAFFAVVHIANISATTFGEGAAQALLQLAVILPVGLVLGWLFLRFGVVAAIAGHVTYNGLLLFLLFLQSASGAAS